MLTTQLNNNKIDSYLQWEQTIDIKDKTQILRDYGLQYVNILKELLKNRNIIENQRIKSSSLAQLFVEYVLSSKQLVNNPFNVQWLDGLFKANAIDVIEFFAWNEIVKTKRYPKINAICLEGQTNAGKSLIISNLTSLIKPEPIPRERDNSAFHLDQFYLMPLRLCLRNRSLRPQTWARGNCF